jgi:Tfp pilus assembly PilM family ATPase
MLTLLKKKIYPIGIDIGSGYVRLAQLGCDGETLYLHTSGCQMKPETIAEGSPDWQRWAVSCVRDMSRKYGFKGKNVVTALPSESLFIDQVRIAKTPAKKIHNAVLAQVSRKLPFPADDAALQYVVLKEGQETDLMILATQQSCIRHHLAIYEAAGVQIQSIQTWPEALMNSYVHFFSRRKEDETKITMLMDIGLQHTNVVICQQFSLLFARMIPIGFMQLKQGEHVQRLMSEIDACCHYFDSVGEGRHIQLLMFLANKNIDAEIASKVAELAQRMQVAAQMGDVMSAIEKRNGSDEGVDRRDIQLNWATAFGLSLAARERD